PDHFAPPNDEAHIADDGDAEVALDEMLRLEHEGLRGRSEWTALALNQSRGDRIFAEHDPSASIVREELHPCLAQIDAIGGAVGVGVEAPGPAPRDERVQQDRVARRAGRESAPADRRRKRRTE